jgi:hypothetical protein
MAEALAEAVPRLELDHLVVAARTLEEGVAWCEATFGVAPSAGGRHVLMSTHNRLLALSSARFPRSYLEIVSIDADAPKLSRARWFDLDTQQVQTAIAQSPRLLHWVARTNAIEAAAAMLRAVGHDPGVPTAAERMTPRGLLHWRISLPADGGRPAEGAVPLLIEWGGEHPCNTMPASGVALERVELGGMPASLAARLGADPAPAEHEQRPAIVAILATPRGRVELASLPV